MSKPIPVLEVFGPTIQGEGAVIGQKTMFVRTGGCDYRCSWCDSAFTWDGTGKSEALTPEQILDRLESLAPNAFGHVTISGGNPALHKGLGDLVSLLKSRGIQTAVETQGSIWQDWLKEIDAVTISPKPPSSGMETNWQQLENHLANLHTQQVSLKVVVFNREDYAYAKHVHALFPQYDFYLQVGNEDPHLLDDQELLQTLLEQYEQLIEWTMHDQDMKHVRVLPQLHTFLWGNKRGV